MEDPEKRMKTPDLYDTLGVPRDAKPRDIKAAYRKRAAAAHPDKGGSDEKLQTINQAWEILGDPEKRRRYDETGEMPWAARTMSRGEECFLRALDEVIDAMLGGRADRTSVLENVRSKLSQAKKKTLHAIAASEEALGKVERQLGRYRRAMDVATLRPSEGENLIESRLLAVKGHLTGLIEGLQTDLAAYGDALAVCLGYEDSQPATETGDPFAHFQVLAWDDITLPPRRR